MTTSSQIPGATAPSPAPERPARWFLRGIGASLSSVQSIVLFAGYVGFGGLVHDVNFPIVAAVLSTFIVWALPAQVLLVGGFAANSTLAVIALAVGLSSVRLFPMVASLLPMLRGRHGLGTQLFASHYVAVTAWVEGMRLLPPVPAQSRMYFFLGFANTFLMISAAGTVAGYLLAGTLPQALANGLLFLTPISFLLQLMRNSRQLIDWLALGFGLAVSPLIAQIGSSLDLLWVGLIGGGAAYLVHYLRKRRPT